MDNNLFNFTKEAIDRILPPEKERVIYKDTKEQGLILIVSYTGKKTFYIAKNITTETGKDYYRKKIGDFPDLSISEARKKVFELKIQIAKGFNPFKKVEKSPKEMTFFSFSYEYHI